MSIIAEVLMPPKWTKSALCAEVDPELFFPDKGDKTAHVKQICKQYTEYSRQLLNTIKY